METRLLLDDESKQLQLAFKKELVSTNGLRYKLKGVLNTVTARAAAQHSLFKVRERGNGRGEGGERVGGAWSARRARSLGRRAFAIFSFRGVRSF